MCCFPAAPHTVRYEQHVALMHLFKLPGHLFKLSPFGGPRVLVSQLGMSTGF